MTKITSFEYKQLCAAIDLLRKSNINLPFHTIAVKILELHRLDSEESAKVVTKMHNKYRKICEEMGLIKKNQSFWVH